MRKKIAAVFLVVSLCTGSQVLAQEHEQEHEHGHVHWGYTGHEGPEHWGGLAEPFSACKDGRNQSPIDIVPNLDADLSPLTITYIPGGSEIINNGHSIQVNYTAGSTLTLDGQVFELKQFHFHTPSENTINGESFPMEAHFVHADKDGNLAVLALMFKEGTANKELAKAWAQMPQAVGGQESLHQTVDAAALLPANQGYYRFNGSLTTPPCSEGVHWIVLKESAQASKEQIAQFSKVIGVPNNRPVQPVNARIVVE
ncbi:carbonic anhydrase [Desulfogranum japonicum]|uniref:carbonic anhydrase n=1 Tax=Desulfogranum japonicum TaxID=231447 RepID=UPI00040C76C7|nr:carbonic anhydrase [Desulfogranum japonicum]